ncbi:phosphate starvation inducible protein [Bacillus phage JL]|uniref:Phosphate starvation inducible protein n=1 Tax=Bacillus phage JL TaxID=1296655 RepID=V5TGC8_9CAUD|nr:phosphate starvation inducible protein [Bacillus phage JL]AHB63467.1 phosphate starvation inducible protein [Bacillus phage JL]
MYLTLVTRDAGYTDLLSGSHFASLCWHYHALIVRLCKFIYCTELPLISPSANTR